VAPSPTEPTDVGDPVDPLVHLRRAAAESPPDWLSRAATLLDGLRHGGADRFGVTVLVAALVLATAAGAVLWQVTQGSDSSPAGSDSAATLPRASVPGAPVGSAPLGTGAAPGSTAGTGPGLVVQAAGAVVRPGVYHLAAGARVGDLVDLAGGLAADADPDRVNLASPLTDGVRVWVPRRGEAEPPAEVGGSGSGPPGGSSSSGSGIPAPLVDLNTATAAELESLPGVGPATAAAIIDYRQRNGPFETVDELAEVRGIGDAKLGQLRELVRV
jgi:competence protein ComEA